MPTPSPHSSPQAYRALARRLLDEALAPAGTCTCGAPQAWIDEHPIRNFARGEPMSRRHHPFGDMLLLVEGTAVYGRYLGQRDAQILGFLGPGDVVCVAAVLDDGKTLLDVQAHSDAKALVVPAARAREDARSCAELAMTLARLVARRSRALIDDLFGVLGQPLPFRLARLLTQVAQRFGLPRDGSLQLDLRLSQADMASALGASRQQVNAELRRFEQRGFLRLVRGRPEITDLEGLLSAGGNGVDATVHALPLPTPRPATEGAGLPWEGGLAARPLADRHILLVEDDPVSLMVLRRQLEQAGARVTHASDGDSGLAHAQAADAAYDALVVDEHMPGLAGSDVVRILRAAGSRVPIVGVSADSGAADTRRFLAAGMDTHLAKPVRAEELVNALCRLLG